MPLRLEFTPDDYEEGVANFLTEKFAGRGSVVRNVRLKSRSGVRARQIDVLVRFSLGDMGEELMVVDCKRYGTRVDVKDVEAFIGLVEDVGAAIGLLVTTEGFTSGATDRAAAARGIRIEVLRVEELPGWEPPELILCELCADSLGEDAFPGMAYIDATAVVETEDGRALDVMVGYCERCAGLHIECPECGVINAVSDMRTDEWIECEGGCGAIEFQLRPMRYKDDLVNPTHDRLTLRVVDGSAGAESG